MRRGGQINGLDLDIFRDPEVNGRGESVLFPGSEDRYEGNEKTLFEF